MSWTSHPLVVFADDYGRHPSSAQHLIAHLPTQQPVLWVNTIGMRAPRLSLSDAQRVWARIRDWSSSGGDDVPTDPRVSILAPRMSPGPPQGIHRWWNSRSMRQCVRDAVASGGLARPIVLTTLPITADLVGTVDEALHIYYCVDDYTQWPGGYGPRLQDLEEELLSKVDSVVATSQTLLREKVPASGRSEYLPHGVDLDRFQARVDAHETLAGLPRPRIGYLGLVDGRHDFRLWEQLADGLPHAQIVLVGPREVEPTDLARRDNVHLIDPVPYDEVPAVLAGFDVAVLPYRVADAGLSVNPLKAKEILAARVPLVASPLPELKTWPAGVTLAESPQQFVTAVEAALESSGPDPAVTDFLAQESWTRKAEQLGQWMSSWLAEKEVARG